MLLDGDYLHYIVNPETAMRCPYQFPAVFGGCPSECSLKDKCPDYDGDLLEVIDEDNKTE